MFCMWPTLGNIRTGERAVQNRQKLAALGCLPDKVTSAVMPEMPPALVHLVHSERIFQAEKRAPITGKMLIINPAVTSCYKECSFHIKLLNSCL